VYEPVAHEGLWTAFGRRSKIGEHLHAHLENEVAVGPGKSRVNLTLPEKLLADLQAEAEQTNRSVSEVVATTIEDAWQSQETALAALKQQMTELANKVELEFATIQQMLSKLIELQEAQNAMQPQRHTEETEPRPKIATYEEMYGPITRTPPPEPVRPPVTPPPRRRWPWSS
jgi:TolA-binding protein